MVHGRESGSRRAGSRCAGSRDGQVQVQVEVEVHLHRGAEGRSTRYVDRGNLECCIRLKRRKAWHFATEQLTGIDRWLVAKVKRGRRTEVRARFLPSPTSRPAIVGPAEIETRRIDFIRNPTTKTDDDDNACC